MTGRLSTAERLVAGSALFAAAVIGWSIMTASVHAQGPVQTYSCATGFGPVLEPPAAPAVRMTSLATVPNPILPNGLLRADLADYIANQAAAIQLGKALFWDMQAGSDNKTACATCHFQAGGDVRTKNQLNPGANGNWDAFGPNYTFGPSDFPFTDPLVAKDTDNVAGSQGIRASTFTGFSKSGAELTTTPAGFRQVTGKNSPPVINAVFNHRQFWNGRAQPDFNGVNPFGSRDTSTRVWTLDSRGSPVQVYINIQNVSLASQAVGPPLNTVEMSAAGRTFPDLGKKLLLAKPLGLQKVDPADSVLGPLADATTGLKTTYAALIKQAFQPKWWNTNKSVTVNGKSYTMVQANFSLFWGLSIMLYEATLVSDSSPMDQYLASRVFDPITGALLSHDPTVLEQTADRLTLEGTKTVTVDDILNGLALFELPVAPPPSFPAQAGFGVGCIGCHLGAETTNASVRNLIDHGLEAGDVAFKNAGFDLRMERMFTKLDWTPPGALSPVPQGADEVTFDPNTYAIAVSHVTPTGAVSIPLPVSTYDTGWYNLGVRPTADDPGLGGTDPFGKALAWTKFFQALPDPSFIDVRGNSLGCAGAGNATFPNQILNASGFPLLSGPLSKTEPSDVDGTFKVSSLRNAEFTGPYFHTGGKSSLMQVVSFYDRGGDFAANPTKAPAIVPLQLTQTQADSLVAFMLALTDERVRWQRAPFDHPELRVPAGQNPDGSDITITLLTVGAGGAPSPLQRFLARSPFAR